MTQKLSNIPNFDAVFKDNSKSSTSFKTSNERTCLYLYLKPILATFVFEHDNHRFPFKDIYNTFYPNYALKYCDSVKV